MTRIRRITPFIRGILPLGFITLNLAFWILPLLVLAVLKLVLPGRAAKNRIYNLMIGIYSAACQVDLFLFRKILGIQFDTDLAEDLDPTKSYLIISNHKSWADILVLQSILIDSTPIIKFIVKKELYFLPLVGLICWAYEYPMVERRSFKNKNDRNPAGKDRQTLQSKLSDIKHHPASIINFAEGTRFNSDKHKKHGSPHQNLLKPRSGGLYFIMNTFGENIDYILDVTISYACPEPVFFRFMGGTCRTVRVRSRKIPMAEMFRNLSNESGRLDHERVNTWLKKLWVEKDRQLDLMIPN